MYQAAIVQGAVGAATGMVARAAGQAEPPLRQLSKGRLIINSRFNTSKSNRGLVIRVYHVHSLGMPDVCLEPAALNG